ncbi:hypothetical protein H0H93_015543 [Arthromyces matolae]|nr:hypothetical protein H0H93_015543 [Arthromyces matolae]
MLAMRYLTVIFTLFISSSTLAAVHEHKLDTVAASLEEIHVRRDGTTPMGGVKRFSTVVVKDDAEGNERHSLVFNGYQPKHNGYQPKHHGSVAVYTIPTDLVEKVECTVKRFSFCLIFWAQISAYLASMIANHGSVASVLFATFGIPSMYRSPPGDCMGCNERMYETLVASLVKLNVDMKRARIILSNSLQLCAHDIKMGAISAMENTAGVVCGAVGIQRPDFSKFKTPPPLPYPVPPPRESGTLHPSAPGPLVELEGVTIDTEPLVGKHAGEPESTEMSSHGLLAPPISVDPVDDRRRRQLEKIRGKIKAEIADGHGDHVVTWNHLGEMVFLDPSNHLKAERESSPNSGPAPSRHPRWASSPDPEQSHSKAGRDSSPDSSESTMPRVLQVVLCDSVQPSGRAAFPIIRITLTGLLRTNFIPVQYSTAASNSRRSIDLGILIADMLFGLSSSSKIASRKHCQEISFRVTPESKASWYGMMKRNSKICKHNYRFRSHPRTPHMSTDHLRLRPGLVGKVIPRTPDSCT